MQKAERLISEPPTATHIAMPPLLHRPRRTVHRATAAMVRHCTRKRKNLLVQSAVCGLRIPDWKPVIAYKAVKPSLK